MAHLRRFMAFAAILVYGPAWSATPAVVAVQACAKVTGDAARLACFDRQVALLGSADGGAAPASASTESTAPGTKLTPEQKMGLPRGKVDKLEAAPGAAPEPVLKDFTARIRSVSAGAGQRQVFVLDNDQVWRQAESKTNFSVSPGDTVRISRGALGSFFMSANSHVATRVARVR
jgi:hypothetical protein